MEDEEGEEVAFKNCSGSLWRSGFMSVVGVWALDGVRGRPAQRWKATMLSFNEVGVTHTYSYVINTCDTLNGAE